jgi:zinc transporter ZupT
LLLGITLTISIFFHEIPHEVGDFSYLLKQNMSVTHAFGTQILSAIGAFVGVYLSK